MDWRTLASILLLEGGWNTVVVMLGAAALGLACGAVGVFTMLRRRALIADAVAHAALPGLAGGFLLGGYSPIAASVLFMLLRNQPAPSRYPSSTRGRFHGHTAPKEGADHQSSDRVCS